MANNAFTSRLQSTLEFIRSFVPPYVYAIRPKYLNTSVTPALLGLIIAHKLNPDLEFSPMICLLTLLTVAFVHGATNVMNTYYQIKRGIYDRHNVKGNLFDAIIFMYDIKMLGIILYVLSLVSLFWLALISSTKISHLTVAYLLGLSLSLLCISEFHFKFIVLGDLILFILFGLAPVLFGYLSQVGQLDLEPIMYAIPLAINTEALLHSINMKNMESDKQAGIYTFAMLIGQTASKFFYEIFLFFPFGMVYVLTFKCSYWFLLPLSTMGYTYIIENELKYGVNFQSLPKQSAIFNCVFGILYILSIMAVDKSKLLFHNN